MNIVYKIYCTVILSYGFVELCIEHYLFTIICVLPVLILLACYLLIWLYVQELIRERENENEDDSKCI